MTSAQSDGTALGILDGVLDGSALGIIVGEQAGGNPSGEAVNIG